MIYVDIDFETRSTVDIKKSGVAKYARHPDTEVLCFVTKCTAGNVHYPPRSNDLTELSRWARDTEVIFRAHNAAFEMQIMEHKLGLRVPPHRWRCSMALALYNNLPAGLDACGAILGLDKQKDQAGKKNMMDMCKPLGKSRIQRGHGDKPAGALDFNWDDDRYHMNPERYENLVQYCIDDVLSEEAIFEKLGELPHEEQLRWERDYIMNYVNGISIDVELCEKAQEITDRLREDLNEECKQKFGFKLTQVADVKTFCGLENTQAPTLEKALEGDSLTDDQRWVVEGRQIVGSKAADKYASALNMEVDGKVYGTMQFMGASQTGRWSGRGLQTQNMARGNFNELFVDEEMELACRYLKENRINELLDLGYGSSYIDILRSTARGMFVGDFAVSDFGQIEARVLAWLAGQEDVLNAFRDGRDLYKETASGIYGVPYEEVTKDQRFIGKVASLSLQFGGGVEAFLRMGANYGIESMEEEKALSIVRAWRKKNQKIVSFAYQLEEDAKSALSSGFKVGCFSYEDDFLRMYLPSGRRLSYYKPEIRVDPVFDRTAITYLARPGVGDKVFERHAGGIARIGTYSGKLANNITQATARDVLANGFSKIPVEALRFTVHDELITEGISAEELDSCMLDLPDWCEGLPVVTESWRGLRYRK